MSREGVWWGRGQGPDALLRLSECERQECVPRAMASSGRRARGATDLCQGPVVMWSEGALTSSRLQMKRFHPPPLSHADKKNPRLPVGIVAHWPEDAAPLSVARGRRRRHYVFMVFSYNPNYNAIILIFIHLPPVV